MTHGTTLTIQPGTQWVAYGGLASSRRSAHDSLYSEGSLEGRGSWPPPPRYDREVHLALRYLLHTNDARYGRSPYRRGQHAYRRLGSDLRCGSEPDGSLYRDYFSMTVGLRQPS